MPCNSLTNFEFEEEEFCCNFAKRHPYGLKKGQLIQLDDVTRIKSAFRNQGQLAPFVCYLVFRIGNFAVDVINYLSKN